MIAACVPNLMDRSRFSGAGIRFVDQAIDAGDAALVLVDLDRCAEVEAFAALTGRTVGFGAHVDGERLQAAVMAGFDEVMARSAFFRTLPNLIGGNGAPGVGSR